VNLTAFRAAHNATVATGIGHSLCPRIQDGPVG
jgi:hypothetical protein